MKSLCLAIFCATAILGACAQRPLTDSEFRGFCYTTIGRRTSCDTLTICDDFDTNVLSVRHASRKACSDACDATYNRLYAPNLFEGCDAMLLTANDWCKKYCDTNYAE